MRFLVDESVGLSVVRCLRTLKHDVSSVQEQKPGIDDAEVCAWADAENRLLITNDKDFGKLIFRGKLASSGVILLRLQDEAAGNKVRVISDLLAGYGNRLAGHFVVASETEVRVRPLPNAIRESESA